MSWGVGVSCWCDPAISRCWGVLMVVTDCCTVTCQVKWPLKKHMLFRQSKWFGFFSEGELLLIMIGLITVVCRGWVGSLTVICRFDLFTLVLHTSVYVFVWICCYFICLFIFWNCLTPMCMISSWFFALVVCMNNPNCKVHTAYCICTCIYGERGRERVLLRFFRTTPPEKESVAGKLITHHRWLL